MARSHGKVIVDIWIDPDWLALSSQAQWAYVMLLSQAKLTLVGSIDYEPHRWAQLAAGLDQDDLEADLAELEGAGFVCIDHTTREVLIRSMTRHDGLRTRNEKLLKGLWGQWKGIASAGLRKVAVDNMPAELFGSEVTPPAAEQMRRSARIDWPIEQAIGMEPIAQSDVQSARHPPSTVHRPPTADAQSVTQSVDLERHPTPRIPEENRSVALEALSEMRASRHLHAIPGEGQCAAGGSASVGHRPAAHGDAG